MQRCDWSIGQYVQTSDEASTILFTYGFRKFIYNVKVLIFKSKISKLLLRNRILKLKLIDRLRAHVKCPLIIDKQTIPMDW